MKGDLLKARDLKPLDNEGLLYLAVRIAIRVAPWCPVGGDDAWDTACSVLTQAGNGQPPSVTELRKASRTILEAGARGAYSGAPEPEWRSRSQAAASVASGLEAALSPKRSDRWKRVVDAGKHAASVFAVQAHAGVMPLDQALTVPWAAMRADIPLVADASSPLTVASLTALGPLWPSEPPAWALP